MSKDEKFVAHELFRWLRHGDADRVPVDAVVACVAFTHGVPLTAARREVERCLRMVGVAEGGTHVPAVVVGPVLATALAG